MESPRSHGYYRISIASRDSKKLLPTNNERAFVITQLQDLLSPRLILGDIPAYRQLSSCIDLLAFSIKPFAIDLLVFSIDATICSDFTHRIIARLSQYQYEYRSSSRVASSEAKITITLLPGPHSALAQSVSLHQLHDDWEFDRYSSIGFYLQDRRGDWVRLWRVTQLYDNDSGVYETLMHQNRNWREPASISSYSPLLAS